MTVTIGWFSTDFVAEPIVDEMGSARAGKQVFVKGQQKLLYGGTYLQRGGMPAMELDKQDNYSCHMSWQYRMAPDGHFQTLNMQGDWEDPDIFWSQRLMHRDAVEQTKRARSTGQICIADLDDAFHVLPKTNIAFETTDSKNNPDFNRRHYWKMLAECNAVIASTDPLRKEMERIGARAFTVRNAIDIERWKQNDPGEGGMFAWIGGVQWRSHDLEQLKINQLPQFLETYGLPFFHGGDSNVPDVKKAWDLAGIDPTKIKVATAPLCPVTEYPSLWDPVGISLIPLERHAFNEGKSWLKQLESCCAGVPYIISAGFREQELLLNEGTAGRVARNTKPSDWWNHWEDLLDPEVRRKEGAINRAVAEEHDIKRRWVDWDVVLKEIIRDNT